MANAHDFISSFPQVRRGGAATRVVDDIQFPLLLCWFTLNRIRLVLAQF